MSTREQRLGLNEAVFREVNERISDLNETFAASEQVLDLVCECSDRSCVERISMPVGDYERVRADSRQFAVVPGHQHAAVEDVMAHEPTYDLVRKRPGDAAEVAQLTDPREV